MALRNRYSQQVLDRFAFTEWRLVEDVWEELILTIPPGEALRQYQHRAEAERLRREACAKPLLHPEKSRIRTYSQKQQIRMGARAILNTAFSSLRASGHLEMKVEDGQRYGRRRERRQPVGEGCNHEAEIKELVVALRAVVYPHHSTFILDFREAQNLVSRYTRGH